MITINNRDRVPWYEGLTVRDILETMRYTYPQLVVTINGSVVLEGAYDTQPIPDNADVRVIHLMAGG